jgi:hypothetical protein
MSISLLGALNSGGELLATGFLRQFCVKSMEVGVSYTCTYEGVTIEWH